MIAPPDDAPDLRPAILDDAPLLEAWRAQPHVREWWGGDPVLTAEKLRDARVSCWMVALDGRPFAYLQDYAVHGWEAHHFAGLPPGSRGLDQFIGEPAMLGRGYGGGMLRQRMATLFAAGAPVLAVDPHPDNARAIAVYEKVGFLVAGPAQETRWGLILPMTARP